MPKLYTQEDFDNAIAAVKCGLSYRKAALQFGVPKSTLTDRITGRKNKGGQSVFTSQEEEGFVEYFKKLAERECGLTSLEVKSTIKCWLDRDNRKILSFKNNVPNSNWLTHFKKRNPSLKIKTAPCSSKPIKCKTEDIESTKTKFDDIIEPRVIDEISPDSTQESTSVEQEVSSAPGSSKNSVHSSIEGTLSGELPIHSKSYTALKALEGTLSEYELHLFYKRFEEPHSIETDVLYTAWKILKNRCVNESPTMVNSYMRSKTHSSYQSKQEIVTLSYPDETMLQLQEIINKYNHTDADKNTSVIISKMENDIHEEGS